MPKITKNKSALHNIEILETFEAGIQLLGHEVKSVKLGNINLKGSYVTISAKEVWLKEAHIAKYQKAGALKGYDPYRQRKLLLNKKEIDKLMRSKSVKGLTIIPISVYTKRGLIKVEIGIGRGLKAHDKRALIKKKEAEREVRRAMKGSVP